MLKPWAGQASRPEPFLIVFPTRLRIRYLSNIGFPLLYQGIFTYLIVIADFGGRSLAGLGVLFFAAVSVPATVLTNLSVIRFSDRRIGYFRFMLPLCIALLLPLVQIGLIAAVAS